MYESGAILLYLADKTKQFIPQDLAGRYKTIEWLFWQMAGLGPMSGQNGHFLNYAPEKVPYAMNRYTKEVNRLYGVLDKQLSQEEFIAGEYSIADMASYPWIVPYEAQQQNLDDFPHLKRWFLAVQARPAVQRAYAKAAEVNPNPQGFSEDAKWILFGQDSKTIRK